MTRRVLTLIAFAAGVALLAVTFSYVDLASLARAGRLLGAWLPLLLLPSAAWHAVRTVAWWESFARTNRPSLARLARVRLAAEAFSFVTIRGLAGEPLKVLLLDDESPAISTAAVVVERLAYTVVTIAILGVAAAIAAVTLPLSTSWLSIFGGVTAAAVITLGLAIASISRSRSASTDAGGSRPSQPPPQAGRRRVARFVRDVRVQLLDLLQGDRRRLVRLALLESLAYVMMALEVWLVLRAADTPITGIGAFAVEAFTRVTSLLSAFIPGNVGALEASNVAAAAAVHAGAGAAALALVRRIRGLFWAAVGFALYPRRRPLKSVPGSTAGITESIAGPRDEQTATGGRARKWLIVLGDPCEVSISDRLAGLRLSERILRAASRAGYSNLLVWTPRERREWEGSSRACRWLGLGVTIVSDDSRWRDAVKLASSDPAISVLAPATIVSPALLSAAFDLRPQPWEMLEVPAGDRWPHSGVFRTAVAAVVDPMALSTRCARPPKTSQPGGEDVSHGDAQLAVDVETRTDLIRAEQTIRRAIYKPTDPYLARFNRRLSLPISTWLIRFTPISANAISLGLIALGIYAGWLFSRGTYWTGVAAAAISLAASILDGCDGELARLKHEESAFGCWLDTAGDYSYYVAIFTGMTIGAVHATAWSGWYGIGSALLGGMLLTFCLLIFLRRHVTNGRPEQLQATTKAHFYGSGSRWAWLVTKLSFCATRSTMPYGIMGLALLGALPAVLAIGTIAAHAFWISLAVKLESLLATSKATPAAISPERNEAFG